MNTNRNLAVLIATATAVALVGLFMTIISIVDASEKIERMQRKADQIRTLRDYEETSRRRRAQQAILEGFRGRPGPSLPALAREIIPDANAEVRERKSTPAMNGCCDRRISAYPRSPCSGWPTSSTLPKPDGRHGA